MYQQTHSLERVTKVTIIVMQPASPSMSLVLLRRLCLRNGRVVIWERKLKPKWWLFSVTQQPTMGQDFLIIEALQSRSFIHTTLSRTPVNEWSAWQHTTLTKDRHPCPRRDWNPQSQQGKVRRPTPYTALPPGSAKRWLNFLNKTDGVREWIFLFDLCDYQHGVWQK